MSASHVGKDVKGNCMTLTRIHNTSMLSVVADRYCVSRIISYLNIPRHPLTILISEGLRLLLEVSSGPKNGDWHGIQKSENSMATSDGMRRGRYTDVPGQRPQPSWTTLQAVRTLAIVTMIRCQVHDKSGFRNWASAERLTVLEIFITKGVRGVCDFNAPRMYLWVEDGQLQVFEAS